jgi:broad specificity phosphatase PhoE
VVVVGHGGVLGAYLAMICGRSPNDLTAYDLLNCSLTHLHVSAAGAQLHRRNDVCHLDAIAGAAEPEEPDRCD